MVLEQQTPQQPPGIVWGWCCGNGMKAPEPPSREEEHNPLDAAGMDIILDHVAGPGFSMVLKFFEEFDKVFGSEAKAARKQDSPQVKPHLAIDPARSWDLSAPEPKKTTSTKKSTFDFGI